MTAIKAVHIPIALGDYIGGFNFWPKPTGIKRGIGQVAVEKETREPFSETRVTKHGAGFAADRSPEVVANHWACLAGPRPATVFTADFLTRMQCATLV